MLSSLKNSLKDQIQLALILFTGVFAGSIFTLIYVKLWEKGDVTFADIGSMLAGAGTVALFIVALMTAKNWKYQNKLTLSQKNLKQLFNSNIEYLGQAYLLVEQFDTLIKNKEKENEVFKNKVESIHTEIFSLIGKADVQAVIFEAITGRKTPLALSPNYSYKKIIAQMENHHRLKTCTDIIIKHQLQATEEIKKEFENMLR